ncbi:WD40 repeat-like protein [Serendipita vermifera]|nr:WD40 repeat-like protein [Serendipita vermifera]
MSSLSLDNAPAYGQILRNCVLTSVCLASQRTWVERWQHFRDDKEEIARLTREINKCSEDFMESVDIIKENTGDEVTKLEAITDVIGEHHNTCLPDTRVKVLDVIREWADNPNSSRILWLTDVAGAGKSTIAKHLSDEWRRKGRLGGCFFFDKNRPETTNTRRLCETIAYQLATSHSRLRPFVLYGIKELGSTPSFSPFADKLQKIVVEPLRHMDLILVIDALDECGKADRGAMLRNLLPSFCYAYPTKILITSRPESDLAQHLNAYRSNTDSLHDVGLKSNRVDISIFVEDQMRFLVQSSTLKQKDVELLTQRVNCLFILASTACKAIQDCLDPSAMLNTLLTSKSNPLSGINTLYQTILRKSCDLPQVRGNISSLGRETIIKVLKTILAAVTPLNIATIDSILDIKTTKHVIGSLSSVLNATPEGPILLLHPTFREFLEDKELAGVFYIDMEDAHRTMAKGCLKIMKEQLRFNICRLESSFFFNKDIHNFEDRISRYISRELQYGCIYWTDHVIGSGSGNRMLNLDLSGGVTEIIDGAYPLYWIEVMSALGKVSQAPANLQDLKTGELENGVKDKIKDIRQFLVAFSKPISESIPHLYISALPFVPVKSFTRQAIQDMFLNTSSVIMGCSERWPGPPLEWRGHTGAILSISFSSDGRRIVSGSQDCTIRLWDAETGQQLGEPLQGHTNAVISVAFVPNEHRIVSGSDDKTLRVWDTETGRPLGEPLRGHTAAITSVAVSPDSSHIASGSQDKMVRLWDAETYQPFGKPLRGHRRAVTSVAFLSSRHRPISGSGDGISRLWGSEMGRILTEVRVGFNISDLGVACPSSDHRIVACWEKGQIHFWDPGANLLRYIEAHDRKIESVVFSPEGNRIASASDDKTIRIWDVETSHPPGEPLRGHIQGVTSVAFSPDGHRIVSGSYDRTIRLWDTGTHRPLGEPFQGHDSAVTSIAFSPDSRRIVSGLKNDTIRLWDAETGQPLGEPLRGHTDWVTSVVFSPDGRYIASGSRDFTIKLWDYETGQSLEDPPRGHEGVVTSVAFSSDGHRIVSASHDKTIRLWDVKTGQPLAGPLKGHKNWVRSVAFSPDSYRIVSASDDGSIRLWDAETGQPLGDPIQGHTSWVTCVAFSPDGRCIVSGSYDKTIRLWDAETRRHLGTPLRGHTEPVRSVVFSPDGLRILSGSDDYTMRLWDAAKGQPLGVPVRGHNGAVTSVAFSPDGHHILSGSDDSTTRLWNADAGQSWVESASNGIESASFFSNKHLARLTSQQQNAGDTPSQFSDLFTQEHFSVPGFERCSLSDDGWVTSLNRLLYWVPPDNRHGLRGQHVLTLPTNSTTRSTWIDFKRFRCGDAWIQDHIKGLESSSIVAPGEALVSAFSLLDPVPNYLLRLSVSIRHRLKGGKLK